MFFYGQFKDGMMRNSKGVQTLLAEYERGALDRGMCFIAFSLVDLYELHGWRYLICGSELEDLQMECQRFWNSQTDGIRRGKWDIMRLDRQPFTVSDRDSYKPKEFTGCSLTI